MASNAVPASDAVAPPPSDPTDAHTTTASPAKKVAAAWKRPANGVVAAEAAAAGPVMDAESWPALLGSAAPAPPAKASPKASPSPSTGSVISPLSLSNSGAPNTNPDHAAVVRNSPARRGPPVPASEGPDKSAAGPEPSPVHVPNNRNDGSAPNHHSGRFTPHPHSRGGGYGGSTRRGDGSIGNGGGRRGQEHHGGFDGHRRGGRGRDTHGSAHQQRGPQWSYFRAPPPVVAAAAPPPPPPFVGPAPPQAPSFGTAIGFPEMAPHVYYFAAPPSEAIQGLPFVPHPTSPPAILIPQIEALQAKLLMQIEYYFSEENLCKDLFLRKNMDEHGWVPLTLIAGFNKVKEITNNFQFIMETVLLSTVLEVQGDNIRRRVKWENWLLSRPSHAAGAATGSLSPVTSNIDALASQLQTVGLEGATYHIAMQGMPGEAVLTRLATSGSLGYQVQTLEDLHGNASSQFVGARPARSLFRSNTL